MEAASWHRFGGCLEDVAEYCPGNQGAKQRKRTPGKPGTVSVSQPEPGPAKEDL